MKGQKYCGSIKDLKFVCPNCKERYFFPLKSYNPVMLDALKKNGPIHISCPWCYNGPGRTGSITVDLDNPKKDWYGDPNEKPPAKDVYDIIYFERELDLAREFEKKIKEKFPSVVLDDCSDCIHGKRTAVNLKGEFREEYFTWLVIEGFAALSFSVNMALMDSNRMFETAGDFATIKKALDQIKKSEA